jgi:hypothetical protein
LQGTRKQTPFTRRGYVTTEIEVFNRTISTNAKGRTGLGCVPLEDRRVSVGKIVLSLTWWITKTMPLEAQELPRTPYKNKVVSENEDRRTKRAETSPLQIHSTWTTHVRTTEHRFHFSGPLFRFTKSRTYLTTTTFAYKDTLSKYKTCKSKQKK